MPQHQSKLKAIYMSAGNKHKKIRLDDIPKENPFRVPEGYFEAFTEKLNRQISTQADDLGGKRRRHSPVLHPWLALAASLFVVALISYALIRYVNNRNGEFSVNGLNYASAVQENIENYDLGQLTDFYAEDFSSDSSATHSDYPDEVIDYLINEDVDLNLIIEDL